jgi:hypothetical protein
MNRMLTILAGLMIVVASASSVQAVVVNIANGAPIIGGTNDLNGQPYNYANPFDDFITSNVTDGANTSPNNNTGTVTEDFADDSYWLGPGGANTPAYFVLDLGASARIASIDLFNTSNGSARERGTAGFTIKASNTITNVGAFGDDLSGTIVTLVSGTLAPGNHSASPGQEAITAQPFLSSDTLTAYRYIRFDAITSGGAAGNNGSGLNEIRIFEVPEPTSLSLLAMGSLAILRRKRHA